MQFVELLNKNQGLVAVSIFILGIIGFFIKKYFFGVSKQKIIQKQKSGDNSVNIQAGRDIKYDKK